MTGRRALASLTTITLLAGAGLAAAQQPIGLDALTRIDQLPRFRSSVAVGSISVTTDRRQRRRVLGQVLVRPQGARRAGDRRPPGPRHGLPHLDAHADRRPHRVLFRRRGAPRVKMKFRELFRRKASRSSAGGGLRRRRVLQLRADGLREVVKVLSGPRRSSSTRSTTRPIRRGPRSRATAPPRPDGRCERPIEGAARARHGAGADPARRSCRESRPAEDERGSTARWRRARRDAVSSPRPGRIAGLRLGPARAFAGKARDRRLKMYWDGDRNRRCPARLAISSATRR